MLILKPYPHVTIWGGERLGKYIEQDTPHIGHLYTVRGTKKDANIILNGVAKGKNLYQYFLENRERWGMQDQEEFPISAALVDAAENLSVQVHPDDTLAYRFEAAAKGKNESFYLLEEPESGRMINGCRCSSKEELQRCVALQDWDAIIDYLQVKKGDYVYVPAGTLHAMTKGALTYEIEENCEYTYRLYDYDRVDQNGNKRQLDTEKAVASIDVAKKSHTRQYTGEEIVEKKYASRLLHDQEKFVNDTSGIICITILEGEGIVDGVRVQDAMSVLLEPGETLQGVEIRRGIAIRIR